MVRIKLTVEYDGLNYCGWQIQNNLKTVQSAIEVAIYKLSGQKVRIHGVRTAPIAPI